MQSIFLKDIKQRREMIQRRDTLPPFKDKFEPEIKSKKEKKERRENW